ncbi:MAG: SdiA-regulated domain-containing protein [Ginsengibacter sp.]
MKKCSFYIIFSLLFFVGCSNNNSKQNIVASDKNSSEILAASSKEININADYQYDLKKPKSTWKLSSPLLEVSGNTWVNDNHLLVIDDRHPNLYLVKLDDKNAVLEKIIPFQKDENDKFDIEDVTIVNDVVYALWSHGILFKISDWNSKPDVKEISTFLSKENNTEGLCYDPVTKKLLIACKYASGISGEDKSTKAVYQFDMTTEKLEKKPFLLIHKKDFEKLAGQKLLFYPSAIAVHPVTHNIYLLSTRENKCMAVFNREGSLISFQFIDEDLMPQPEGICFSPGGALYISSEGKNGEPGKLFLFERK